MVRVLPCHNFNGQKIGKVTSEESVVGVAVAGNFIIVGFDHQVNVYLDGPKKEFTNAFEFGEKVKEIGTPFKFKRNSSIVTIDANSEPKKYTRHDDENKELSIYNKFSTIDSLLSISYNEKGNYILCLEKLETGMTSIRSYFHWEFKDNNKPMRARLAGLVSPTDSDLEDDETLIMVEMPNIPASQAIFSCNLTGHIVTCSDSTLNIFIFKIKEATGRVKINYPDFDHLYTFELYGGFKPTKIFFLTNFIACMSHEKCIAFKIGKYKESETVDKGKSPLITNAIKPVKKVCFDKVKYDPKSETVETIHLNTIVQANRKIKIANTGITEEFQNEVKLLKEQRSIFLIIFLYKIPRDSKLVANHYYEDITIEDLLKIVAYTETNSKSDELVISRFVDALLVPIRIKDELGGVNFVIGTSSEAFIYHLPTKANSIVSRVIHFPLTSSLIALSYDSIFLHALTDTGLETYTSRLLYNPLKDIEGFFKYLNDCPFQNEQPCLIGIKPFLEVKFITANENLLVMLASPPTPSASSNSSNKKPSIIEEENNQSTIYSLHLPNLENIYNDILKAAELVYDTSPETYLVLISEIHLILRNFTHVHPGKNQSFLFKYFDILKIMGFQHFKEYSKNKEETGEEFLDKGATYLNMAHCDLAYIFSLENVEKYTKDELLIPGIVKLIKVLLPKQIQSSKMSPNLARQLIEFVSLNDPESLVQIVIDCPRIREIYSSRLVEILKSVAEKKNYTKEVTLSVLLVLMTMSGGEKQARSQVKDLLSKCNLQELDDILDLHFLIERKGSPLLTDLTICLLTLNYHFISEKFTKALKKKELSLDEILVSCVQSMNLSNEQEVQQALSKTLCLILEDYFRSDKLSSKLDLTCTSPPPILSDEQVRGVQGLARIYLSHVPTLVQNSSSSLTSLDESINVEEEIISKSNLTSIEVSKINLIVEQKNRGNDEASTLAGDQQEDASTIHDDAIEVVSFDLAHQIFGKVPTFTLPIFKDFRINNGQKEGFQTYIVALEAWDSFAKLVSMLSSNLVNVKGVKELVLEFLNKNSVDNKSPYLVLQLLVESTDQIINTLILKYPTIIIIYAKEMFGKSTDKWKTLVNKLKEKILQGNDEDLDVFSTIIESVYMYISNFLSPSELELVLEKVEENSKYHDVCGRIELANHYSSLVIAMSNEYLRE